MQTGALLLCIARPAHVDLCQSSRWTTRPEKGGSCLPTLLRGSAGVPLGSQTEQEEVLLVDSLLPYLAIARPLGSED